MDFSQLKALVLCFAVLALVGCSTASKTPRYVNPQALQVASMVGDAQPGDYIALPAQSGLGADNVVVDRTYIAASGRQCRRLRTVDGRPVQRVACKGSDGIWLLARDLRSVSSLDVTAGSGTKSSVVRFADEPDQTLVPVVNPPRLAGAEPVTIVPIEPAVQEYAVPVEAVPLQFSAADASMLQRAESLIISRPDHARRMGARPLIETLDNRSVQISSEPLAIVAAEPEIETVKRVVNVNETLWSFAKRNTGSGLNWKRIARINGITDAKTLAAGTPLYIPVELVGQGG